MIATNTTVAEGFSPLSGSTMHPCDAVSEMYLRHVEVDVIERAEALGYEDHILGMDTNWSSLPTANAHVLHIRPALHHCEPIGSHGRSSP